MEEFVNAVKIFVSRFAQDENFCQGQLLSISQNEAFFSVKAKSQKGGGVVKIIEGRVPLSDVQSYKIGREIGLKRGGDKKTHVARPGRKKKFGVGLKNDFLKNETIDYRFSRYKKQTKMTLEQIIFQEGVSLSEN